MNERKITKTQENDRVLSNIDRRTFLKGGLIAGTSLLGASSTLWTPKSAFAGTSQTPKYGGKVRLAIPDSPITFDPSHYTTVTERWMPYLLYNTLTYLTPDMKVVPSLAESWKAIENGKVWIFYLRKGVKFHNGREFEAKDVASYFNRVMDPKSGSAAVKALSPLESAEVIDKYTVKIYLSASFADFHVNMALDKSAIIAPESAGRDTKKPIGTGPFKFKEFIPGEKVIFEKNPDYWKKGEPYLDIIEWVNIPDPATQVSALASGSVDALMELSPDFVGVLKKAQGTVVEETPTGAHQPVVMQLDKKPFNDPRVVTAIKLCLNREEFVDLALNGHGVPANDVSVPPNNPYYHGIPIKKQNYKLAKKLLNQAGYPNGLDLELYSSHVRTGMVPTAITLKNMCEPVGIRINVTIAPTETYWKQTWRMKTFFVSNWTARPTVHGTLHQFFHQSSFNQENPGGLNDIYNTSHFVNPTLSELLDRGMSELKSQKRREYYIMAQTIIMENAGWLTPYNSNFIRARRKELHNLTLHPTKICDMSLCWKSA